MKFPTEITEEPRLMGRLNLRLNGNYLSLSLDRKIDDIDFSADLTLGSLFGLLDWHPFANNFRISASAVYNGNELELRATPTRPVEIGDLTYLPVHVGTLTGSATFSTFAGYIGIGFGNAVEKSGDGVLSSTWASSSREHLTWSSRRTES